MAQLDDNGSRPPGWTPRDEARAMSVWGNWAIDRPNSTITLDDVRWILHENKKASRDK